MLFSDIRSFTPFVEDHLPYDVVHILNRYFYSMGDAVLKHEGIIDKYMGDGIMALFGTELDCPEKTCVNAVSAALEMQKSLQPLNQYLQKNFGHEFAIGIGIDFGDALVGHLGHPDKQHFTAIGNTVNIASRIEAMTKETQTQILVSQSVLNNTGNIFKTGQEFSVQLKGTSHKQNITEILF